MFDKSYETKKRKIKFKSYFILDKNTRKRYRSQQLEKLKQAFVKDIKWGISYSVFDGEELLEASIRSVRDAVDYINVVWQDISWNGKYKASPNLYSFLSSLKKQHLIDEIIQFTPNLNIAAYENELIKRNIGLSYAQKSGVNYFMAMDCDEFYIREELENVKKEIIDKEITNSYCPIIDYWTKPSMQCLKLGFYAVPLFAYIDKSSQLGNNSEITLSDPTRGIITKIDMHQYFFCNIQMHHFSLVRKNLHRKLKASSSPIVQNYDAENYIVPPPDVIFVEVPNRFNIDNF